MVLFINFANIRGGGGCGIDESFYFGFFGGEEHLDKASYVDVGGGHGVFDGAGYAAEGGLVEDVVATGDGFLAVGVVADVAFDPQLRTSRT